MFKDNVNISIASEDLVFMRLIEIMLNKYLTQPHINKIFSFVELKEILSEKPPDLFIIDDFIKGAASLEVITFLRFNRRLTCPIYFFCEKGSDIEHKAFQRGANFCITKPFDPMLVVDEIISNLK